MQVHYIPTKCKVVVLIDSESDTIFVKNEDFPMEIFSYYDVGGKKLFTAKQSDVELLVTGKVYLSVAEKAKVDF